MRALVTGASGFIGKQLTLRLLNLGFSVRVLTRSSRSSFPEDVEVVIGDLITPDASLESLLSDCDFIFHCAGEIRNISTMNSLHVDGTRFLLGLLKNRASNISGARLRWVQLSSVGVYGPPIPYADMERVVSEDSPINPVGEYEKSKSKSDELVINAGCENLIDYSILRPSNVIGVQMRNSYVFELIKTVKKSLFFYIGRKGSIATFVHVDDVVSALVQCAISPHARNQIYNLSYDCTLESVIARISSYLGVPTPRLRIQESLIRVSVKAISKFVDIPLTKSRIDSLVSRTHYPAIKIIRDLNFIFSRPMPESIDDLVSVNGTDQMDLSRL
jgi:nucleoside-diphosphate-sugar epimerase